MGLINLPVAIMVAVMSILILMALTPTLTTAFGMGKGSNGANCVGYIDPTANAVKNNSYDSTLNTDNLTCTILDFGLGAVVLGVLMGVIAGVMTGDSTPQQNYYGG